MQMAVSFPYRYISCYVSELSQLPLFAVGSDFSVYSQSVFDARTD
jgi:hypothetical protein